MYHIVAALSVCMLLSPHNTYAESGTPGPFVEADSVTWKVNDFPIVRWKTLVGGNEGGQIEQPDVQFGLWELAPRGVYHGHRHTAPEIYYVTAGVGEWHVGEHSQRVGPGTTVYTAPGEIHKMINLSDEPLQAVWLWWAPDGRREVFSGPYEYTEPAPESMDETSSWTQSEVSKQEFP